MSRVLRNELMSRDCYAHVISRSIRSLKLFNDLEDFSFFKESLLRAKQKSGFKIFHYCLMQTHFHLVVQMGDVKGFSFAVRDIKRDYVYKFHGKYKISGPIWRERYKSLLIENESYLYACGKYIEDNPVKAEMVKESINWEYSSARHYELRQDDDLIDPYDTDCRVDKECMGSNQDFERGSVIGSDFYRFQFFQSRRQNRPVPFE